jgi:hypothetical protein
MGSSTRFPEVVHGKRVSFFRRPDQAVGIAWRGLIRFRCGNVLPQVIGQALADGESANRILCLRRLDVLLPHALRNFDDASLQAFLAHSRKLARPHPSFRQRSKQQLPLIVFASRLIDDRLSEATIENIIERGSVPALEQR